MANSLCLSARPGCDAPMPSCVLTLEHSLRELNAEFNCLTKLPDEIKQLRHLENLKLHNWLAGLSVPP